MLDFDFDCSYLDACEYSPKGIMTTLQKLGHIVRFESTHKYGFTYKGYGKADDLILVRKMPKMFFAFFNEKRPANCDINNVPITKQADSCFNLSITIAGRKRMKFN